MYPSLPKFEVINEVERRLREKSFKTAFDKEVLIRLVKLSVDHMEFKIFSKSLGVQIFTSKQTVYLLDHRRDLVLRKYIYKG